MRCRYSVPDSMSCHATDFFREYEKKSVNNHKVFYDTMKNYGGPLIIVIDKENQYITFK